MSAATRDPVAHTDVGRRIDEFIERAGLSRRQVAEKLGRNPSSFNYTVSRADIRATVLLDIANALGTSLHYLLTGDHDPRLHEIRDLARRKKCPAIVAHVRSQMAWDEGQRDDE